MHVSERVKDALVVLGIGLAALVVVRVALGVVLGRVDARLASRPRVDAQRLRTQLGLVRRVVMILLIVVIAWNVLDVFPATRVVGQTLLASSAVIAIFVGIAVQTPLSNLGSGLLLALAQPVRLGDRASVAGVSGTVADITAIHTVFVTDDERRVSVPNSLMISSAIENRTILDARRLVDVRLPVRLHAPIADALARVEDAARGTLRDGEALDVRVVEIADAAIWIGVEALVEAGATAADRASAIRVAGLEALGSAALLPPETA